MAGTPIKRLYNARIQTAGGAARVLDRIAAGERFVDIARAIDVSRTHLSDYLFKMAGGRSAVHVARCLSAEASARSDLEKAEAKLRAVGRGATDAMIWIRNQGGFRQAAGSEPTTSSDIPGGYVSQREMEMGRSHLESMKRAAERERSGHSDEAGAGTHSDPPMLPSA